MKGESEPSGARLKEVMGNDDGKEGTSYDFIDVEFVAWLLVDLTLKGVLITHLGSLWIPWIYYVPLTYTGTTPR